MTDSLLEQCRLLHAEAEHLKEIAAAELTKDPRGFRDDLRQQELLNARLLKIIENSKKLQLIYEDKDEVRTEELQEIIGRNAFHVFYNKVRELKKPKHGPVMFSISAKQDEADVRVDIRWSGPEWQGRFVDMHTFHQKFLNLLPESLRKDYGYKKFLKTFHHFHRIPNKNSHYKSFLESILLYLFSFWDRRYPTYPSTRCLKVLKKEFDANWKAKNIPGFFVPYDKDKLENLEKKALSEASLGPQIPDPLADPALFCYIMQRWYANSQAFKYHLEGKKYKRKAVHGIEQHRELAWIEAQVALFYGLVDDAIAGTCSFVEKQETKTYDEIKREMEEQELEGESDVESEPEDMGNIYNPLNIPVDFDGKPIPYWLYKFRGLNRYFKCQICGNREYRGPMAFERHFSEWRHAHGMRTLGIPNTKDFMWITNINDAIALWSKIKDRKKDAVWNPADEEVEDMKGRVFNRPTFENLTYQQLIS